MPRARESRGEWKTTRRPSKRISPASGRCTPVRTFISVDLPAALSPTRPSTSPAWSSRSAPASACTAPKALLMPRISTRGGDMPALISPLPQRRHGHSLEILRERHDPRAQVQDDARAELFAGEPRELVQAPKVGGADAPASCRLDPDQLAAFELQQHVDLDALRCTEMVELRLLIVPGGLLAQRHDHEVFQHGSDDRLLRQAGPTQVQERRRQPRVGEEQLRRLENAGRQPRAPARDVVNQKSPLEQSHVALEGRVRDARRSRHVGEVQERRDPRGEQPDEARQSGDSLDARQLAHVALEHRGRVRAEPRSEEHTSELQSPCNLVCRLLLEKKKKKNTMVWMQTMRTGT